MARLFFTLYIAIVGAVFAIFLTIDQLSSKHFYNVEVEAISRSVNAYKGLFDKIHQLGGEKMMIESMHRALNTEDLLLQEITDPATLAMPKIKNHIPHGGKLH